MKKRIMVHYHLVPSDEYNPLTPDRCLCLRLTRSKIIAVIIIFILSAVMIYTAFVNSSSWSFQKFLNTTPCVNSTAPFPASQTSNCYDNPTRHATPFYRQRLPSVIIIGARKAGTRALIQFVSLHKFVAAAKKETHYFDRHYDRDLEWYRLKMPLSHPYQITMEKTPNYFVDRDVPERIYRYNSTIKLLLIVRNPIDRAMSDYLQLKEKTRQNHPEHHHSFEELVIDQDTGEINRSYSPIKRSLYCRHIDKWLRFFPLSQILILDGENIKIRPWEEIIKVEKFLGIPETINRSRFIFNETKGFFCIRSKFHNTSKVLSHNQSYHIDNASNLPFIERCLAKSKGREHPAIEPRVRSKLVEFFEPYNKRFFERVRHRFNWY